MPPISFLAAAGNMLNDGDYVGYTWDAEGRMTSAESGGTTYTYNALGQRVQQYLYSYYVIGSVYGAGGEQVARAAHS